MYSKFCVSTGPTVKRPHVPCYAKSQTKTGLLHEPLTLLMSPCCHHLRTRTMHPANRLQQQGQPPSHGYCDTPRCSYLVVVQHRCHEAGSAVSWVLSIGRVAKVQNEEVADARRVLRRSMLERLNVLCVLRLHIRSWLSGNRSCLEYLLQTAVLSVSRTSGYYCTARAIEMSCDSRTSMTASVVEMYRFGSGHSLSDMLADISSVTCQAAAVASVLVKSCGELNETRALTFT